MSEDITADAPLAIEDQSAVLAPLPDIGLTDQRDIVFAVEVARSGDPIRAVMRSGHESGDLTLQQIAERVLARPDIQRAIDIAKRQTALMRAADVTYEATAAAAWELFETARTQNRLSDANASLKLFAQLSGFLIERREIRHSGSIKQLTEAQLEDVVARHLAKQGAVDAEYEMVEK